jgi:arylsulfatase A-like enzyme
LIALVTRPHILILMTDQQRADSLRCAGHLQLRTPNIDRLAAEGIRFAQATTASPLCMPARASFATGLYPHNHGIWLNRGELRDGDETFFGILRGAGYFTASIGKSHYYDPRQDGRHVRDREGYMHARGLDFVHETTGAQSTIHMQSHVTDDWKRKGVWEAVSSDYHRRELPGDLIVDPSPVGVDDYLDSYVGRQAAAFVDTYDGAAPLCLFVGFPGPHEPFDAPGPYATMYRPEDTPRPIPIPPVDATLPERIRSAEPFKIWPQSTLERIPQVRASYYGKISLIDSWVGRILEAFERKRWLDDTLVVFLSDHGEMLGDHGRLKKSTFHESNVRIPLILRWPLRIRSQSVSDALAEIGDVFPTLLEASGCAPSSRSLGRSLWPALVEPGAEIRSFQLGEVQLGDRQFMLRSRRYKLAIDSRSKAYMLYDLAHDPEEQHNLAADPAARALKLELRHALSERLEETGYRSRHASSEP